MALTLSVLTLNIWGIPIVSKASLKEILLELLFKTKSFFQDKDFRVRHIAEKLVQSDYDIISLQEVWSEYDYVKIKERLKPAFPYSHYFYSGVFGSGLCVFSRYKIISSFFHHWPVNGYVHKIQHGDWFGGKGVGLCKIRVDDQIINFYLAHVSSLTCGILKAYVTILFFSCTPNTTRKAMTMSLTESFKRSTRLNFWRTLAATAACRSWPVT